MEGLSGHMEEEEEEEALSAEDSWEAGRGKHLSQRKGARRRSMGRKAEKGDIFVEAPRKNADICGRNSQW